jgi:hypothetical protein
MASSLEKEIHDLMAAMTPVVPQEKKIFLSLFLLLTTEGGSNIEHDYCT